MNKIHLNFTGYWRATHLAGLPDAPGVYCVYACAFDPRTGTVQPRRLIYTGEAIRVRSEVGRRVQDWRRYARAGEELCFTYAPIILQRRQAAAALAAHHEPVAADLVEFPFEDTELILSGKIPYLAVSFRMERAFQAAMDAAG
jgi:hypothetical protein